MIDIVYDIIVAILILLYYLFILTDMNQKVIIRVFIITFLVGGISYLSFWLIQRKNIKEDMIRIWAIAESYKNLDRHLSEVKGYDDLLLEIDRNEKMLDDLLLKSTLVDKVLGKSVEVDSLSLEVRKLLDGQRYRICRLNYKSSHKYNPTNLKDASSELKMLNPDVTDRNYINSGFSINHSSMFIEKNVLMVRIVEMDTDSILYQQTYVPKDSINSFVLPNFLQMTIFNCRWDILAKRTR